jgi:hypothetical protein
VLQVDLREVYTGLDYSSTYRLCSMVCYRGEHYRAFVLLPGSVWAELNDAEESRVGSWADVRSTCEQRRLQPTVLFYEAV